MEQGGRNTVSGQILGEIFVARNTPLNLAPLEITYAQSPESGGLLWTPEGDQETLSLTIHQKLCFHIQNKAFKDQQRHVRLARSTLLLTTQIRTEKTPRFPPEIPSREPQELKPAVRAGRKEAGEKGKPCPGGESSDSQPSLSCPEAVTWQQNKPERSFYCGIW